MMNTNEDETIELAEHSIENGVRQGARGRYADAIKTFDQAVVACLKFKGDSDAVRLLAARALGNKGAASGDFNRNSEAVKCYDAAILIYEQMAEQNSSARLMVDQAVSVTLFASGLLLTGPFYSQPKVSRAGCPLLDIVECSPGRLLDRNRQTTPDGRLSGSAILPTQAAGLVASSLRY